jgi:hypothetical protein
MLIPIPKSIAFIIILIACSIHAYAQNGMPAFGKIDKAELLMNDCEFDKGASAVKLIDWGYTYYDKSNSGASVYKTLFERRTRIKILNKKGLDQADVHITFYSYNNDENLVSINACTYNITSNGNIVTTIVKGNSIYTKKINKYYSEMIIAFPEAKVGSIIEFKYTLERQRMGTIRDWYFQERIPVVFCQYQLKIPQLFRFFVQRL